MSEELVVKKASDFHWMRRIWHFLGVMAMVVLYAFMNRDQALVFALIAGGFLFVLDVVRLFSPALNRKLIPIFKPFLRSHETHSLTAASYLLIGVTITIAFFPKEVVLLTLIMLSVADPMAAVFGIRYGKDRLVGKKTLQGSIAAFAICTLVGFGYFVSLDLLMDRLVLASVLVGAIGAVSELIPVFKWDDNLTFPIISSSLLSGLFYIFGVL